MPIISDYLYRKASRNKIPLNVAMELSPVCNFACRMCYVRKTPEQIRLAGKRVRDWTEWLSLAKDLKEEGTLYLLLTGGEPFLYPHFRELYETLHDMSFLISINSNGSMIDEKTVEWLKKKAPTRINITLYGASPETYGRICGNPDGYQRTVNAILMLKEAGIPVVINASMIPENICDMAKIIEFGKKHGINTRVATYMFPPVRRDREQRDSRFTPEEAAKNHFLRQRCYLGDEKYQDYVKEELNNFYKAEDHVEEEDDCNWGQEDEFMTCRAGRSSFWVSWDGSMVACGLMEFPMICYLFEENVHDCWMKLTNAVRTLPVLNGCNHCAKKELCHPCAAMIWAEEGDVNKKASYLCEMADHMVEILKQENAECQISEKEIQQDEA